MKQLGAEIGWLAVALCSRCGLGLHMHIASPSVLCDLCLPGSKDVTGVQSIILFNRVRQSGLDTGHLPQESWLRLCIVLSVSDDCVTRRIYV